MSSKPNSKPISETEPEPEPKPAWSSIHEDILESISQNLKKYSDYIRFRAVCKSWRSFLPPLPRHHLPIQLPWLLLPTTAATTTVNRRAFYDVSTGKTHSFPLLQASYPRRIVGSSNGSIVLVDHSPHIFCYNPITEFKVFLAPLSTLPGVVSFNSANVGREYSIHDPLFENVYTLDLRLICNLFLSKVVLSTSPTNPSCLALAMISRTRTIELAYCKCGDSSWKSLSCEDFSAQDVIYCQSKELFYAVNQIGDVAFFSPSNMKITQISRNVDTIEGDLKYLVKSKEGLLLVARYLEGDLISYCEVYETTEFRVYQFHEVGNEGVHWERVTDLGDEMVFIGNNMSLALLASDFSGCKGNRIYYADDHSDTSDAGIYDLSNGCIEPLPRYPQDGSSPMQCAPPVWFTPNPC